MRNQLEILEKNLKKVIASNLKRSMDKRGYTQIKLSEKSGIPQSTISDILKEKFIVHPNRIQKFADVLGVKKADIEPIYVASAMNIDIELDSFDTFYFEGAKLSSSDVEMIKNMIRICIIDSRK